ncbi:MAG: hypothetical protein IJQ34_01455 [Kiritimatiellae bacterium]|nr:hypothetical protein [Kiritimatiellia bacterium]
MIGASILMLALTRAEIIERFQAPTLTMANGFVQVIADCPADMRREYQGPIASFAGKIGESLQLHERLSGGNPSRRFKEPAALVYIGECRTNISEIVVLERKHDDGTSFLKIYLTSPAYADLDKFRLEIVKAYYLATKDEHLSDEEAKEALIAADPDLRAQDDYMRLDKWLKGEVAQIEDDEEYLRLARSVIVPGVALPGDVLRFASRLHLYPSAFDAPFAQKYRSCTFAEAIDLADQDPRIRLAAYSKASQIIAYGGGRSEELAAASKAYSEFLLELARFKKPKDDLRILLENAEAKLEIALEEARKCEERTL